jgi:protein subunit release factor B
MRSHQKTNRRPLFSLSKDGGDFTVEYFSGTGPGGQFRNHHCMCCRIRHPKSGAMATCAEERSQEANRRRAFRRLVESDRFKGWLRLEISRRSGEQAGIEAAVDRSLGDVKIEVKNDRGLWEEAKASELAT